MKTKSTRFFAVLLAVMMAVTAVLSTGCAKKDNNDEAELSGIITMNMYVVTEKETSPEAAKAVQMAINEITVPQHKMLVKINYLTEDAYWDAIDEQEAQTIQYLEEQQAKAKLAKDTKKSSTKNAKGTDEEEEKVPTCVEEMSFNQAIDYVFELTDVELQHPQLDVFVVNDYDRFRQLQKDGKLAEIDVKYDRKVLTKYIHPTIFTTTFVDNKTYGVPVNFKLPGEYEFLVFNKDLLDKYGYTVNDLRKVEDMGEYFAKIKANEPGVYPINTVPELAGAEIYDDMLFTLSPLTSVSPASFPLYLNNTAYMAYLNAVNDYKKNGYIAYEAGLEEVPCAVRTVYSEILLDHEWTDKNGTTYQAYLYDIPRIKTEDAFKSAMCVSAYCMNKSKAAELIELFNTDATLANLLQYGIQGTHYREEDGIVTFIETEPEETYRMNNFYTGNTYIKYATEDTKDYVANAKETNLSVAPSAFFGYTAQYEDNINTKSLYECIKLFSGKAMEAIESGEMSVDDVFNIASKQLNVLGVQWDASGSHLVGDIGTLTKEQATVSAKNTSAFVLAEEAKVYNDVYKSQDDIDKENAEKLAEKEAAEAEKKAAEEAALDARIEAENAAKAAEEAEENGELEEEPDKSAEEK